MLTFPKSQLSKFRAKYRVVFLTSVLLGALLPPSSFGQSHSNSGAYEYPELQVTPRASETLLKETKDEKGSRFRVHFPLQIPGAAVFIASLLQYGNTDLGKDPNKRAALAGTVIGGSWIAGTLLLSTMYHPYRKGYLETKGMPTQSKRQRLARERKSEEILVDTGSLAKKLSWLSFLSNFGASAYMLMNAEKNSIARVLDGVALIASFTPIIFRHHWWKVAKRHRNYKKRIYSPVASVSPALFTQSLSESNVTPGLALNVRF